MNDGNGSRDPRVRDYRSPTRVVWATGHVAHPEVLLEQRDGQATLRALTSCTLHNDGTAASLLLDFGKELHGGVQLTVWSIVKHDQEARTARIRLRFGESAMEAMSEVGGPHNATNDHAIRDQVLDVSFLGSTEFGATGFRFVRIDLLEEQCVLQLKSVRAVHVYRELAYKGSFTCSDPLLNQIWETGAYTVHLNMQDYLWDGIKRDRLVWIGDLHPETSTVQALFCEHEIVPASLDLIRDNTPLPAYMNGTLSYSVWWIIIQHDWYRHTGNLGYLQEQRTYLLALLAHLDTIIDANGQVEDPNPFLDWPTSANREGVRAGIHALLVRAMQDAAKLCGYLGESAAAQLCQSIEAKLLQGVLGHNGSKQAAALMALAGTMEAGEANREVIAVGGARAYSTFYGYYLLQAKARAGDIQGCLDDIRAYWGGMLQLGATTFWEDFDLEWLDNAARIDELTPPGKIDVHGQYGRYCYEGYRHSFCHGWASGPTPWLMEHVLGVEVVEPGCKAVRINARLGDLDWAKGTFPTPYGGITIKHRKRPDGSIASEISAPPQVKVLVSGP